ncbi:MAG: CBS domain-containing protein [Actinomycetota bacterium]
MTVEAILKNKGSNVFTIRPEHSVAETAKLLSTKKVGVAVVCDAKGRIMGVLSERDIVNGLSQYGKGALDMPVRNVMSSPVLTCKPSDTAREVLQMMNSRRIRHLPVVEGEELVGIVSIGDAVNHRLQQAQLEMGVLRDFAATR